MPGWGSYPVPLGHWTAMDILKACGALDPDSNRPFSLPWQRKTPGKKKPGKGFAPSFSHQRWLKLCFAQLLGGSPTPETPADVTCNGTGFAGWPSEIPARASFYF